MRIYLSVILTLFISLTAIARPLTVDEKLADLEQLVFMMRAGYGPLQYKEQELGISLDNVANRYRQLVSETQSNGEFYYTILQFVAEFKDGHFGAYVPTDHSASLPFTVDYINGKVLIDNINREKLPESEFNFQRGDEVVRFAGHPIMDELLQLTSYVGNGFDLSNIRGAAMFSLTNRRGSRLPVQTGSVEIAIRRGTSDIIDTVTLEWEEKETPIDERIPSIRSIVELTPHRNYLLLSQYERIRDLMGAERMERSFICSGSTRIEIPEEATIIMEEPFVAYYYPTAKGNVGYLRIPHYSPRDENGEAAFEERFEQYKYAVSVLEENTVGLVIDQDHNCGGSVDYLNKILGLFMNTEYLPMQFRLLATKQEYLDFKDWAENHTWEHTQERENVTRVANLIRSNWEAGEFMTPLISIGGETSLAPNEVHYTKPIVMLIDEMSGSGGDAFPALMGGYGRAVLLGTRTSGLGGHVERQAPLYFSQIGLRMTKSLFYRPDGIAVENNGAAPSISYTPTRDDFMYGYRNYRNFYTEKLLELVQ